MTDSLEQISKDLETPTDLRVFLGPHHIMFYRHGSSQRQVRFPRPYVNETKAINLADAKALAKLFLEELGWGGELTARSL